MGLFYGYHALHHHPFLCPRHQSWHSANSLLSTATSTDRSQIAVPSARTSYILFSSVINLLHTSDGQVACTPASILPALRSLVKAISLHIVFYKLCSACGAYLLLHAMLALIRGYLWKLFYNSAGNGCDNGDFSHGSDANACQGSKGKNQAYYITLHVSQSRDSFKASQDCKGSDT